jgi:hypothetical protein
MLTLNQMIGQIEEALNINSDDSNLSERYIIDLINQSRAFHLRNELNKFRTADDTVIQNLPCVELAVSDATLVPGLTLPTECRLLRSINRLPDTIELHHTDGIVSVGSVQFLEIPFSHVDFKRIPYINYSRFTKNVVYSFLLDGYLFLYSVGNNKYSLMETVMVRGIFEDPTAAAEFCNLDGSPCFNYDSPYPIASWMFETLVKPQVLQQVSIKLSSSQDNENNANDDIGKGARQPAQPE